MEGDEGLGELGEVTKQKPRRRGRAGLVAVACERGGGQVISGRERHLQQEDSRGRTGLAMTRPKVRHCSWVADG